ncbi:MAG: NERD domain-containing protein [Clostridia bacterium]|nr:NERD domain-containing protein [Clostridia bacterium]
MGFLVPILMCLAFILVWIRLTKWILALDRRLMKKSLLRSVRLDMRSTAALLSLCLRENRFLYERWFPKRSPRGTLYEEIPCVLLLGKKIFVLEICYLPGLFQNTDAETWRVIPPAEYKTKKEVQIKNPVLLAQDRASLLTELLDTVGSPFEISVESMAVFTDKDHRCAVSGQKGVYTVTEAIAYLSRFAPKTKAERKKMKRANKMISAIFGRYSLSRRQAIARNNKMRTKKK